MTNLPQKWLVIGASGLLGRGLCRHLAEAGVRVTATVNTHRLDLPGVDETKVDLLRSGAVADVLSAAEADVVVHTAGLTNVDACEGDEALAAFLHAEVPGEIASLCQSQGRRLVAISTDHLWDGARALVGEDEPLMPVNAYARTKAEGEARVREAMPGALILRTNFFGAGPPWRLSLSDWMLRELRAGRRLNAFADAYFTPIGVPLLSRTIAKCVAAGLSGTYHTGGGERLSKHDFALRLADWCALPRDLVAAGRLADANLAAPRPLDMSLATGRLAAALGRPAPGIDESLRSVLGERASRGAARRSGARVN